MRHIRVVVQFFILCFSIILLSGAAWASEQMPAPETYLPVMSDIMSQKASYDDKRNLMATYHPKDILPEDVWKWMHFDQEKMGKQTAEILGFTAPELVGKVSPEIESGKYSYKDLDRYPGLRELFPPVVLKTIRAGGPPHVCTIMDFEIEPTRQLHWSLSVCEATKQNLGKSKLDKDGYIIPRTWQGGVPFPRPSGKFKAQQVYYNLEKRFVSYDECFRLTGEGLAFDRNLKIDKFNKYGRSNIKLMGRSFFPPFGWFDERAEKRGEFNST